MDFERLKSVLSEWAKGNPFIKKVFICGSRARNDYREDSDLDIVVEIDQLPFDTTVRSTWFGEAGKLKKELKLLLPYDFDLLRYDPDNPSDTEYAKACLDDGYILVYSSMTRDD